MRGKPRGAFLLLLAAVAFAPIAQAFTTPPVPVIEGPVRGPGPMYPEPAINVVPGAARVEDFPYATEEYFVSGSVAGEPYVTRIIVRRPSDPSAFSGSVVAEALHAGGRSLIFEWSRVSILTRGHLFVEIVHSPSNVGLLQAFNPERYATLVIAESQTNGVIAQVGRLLKRRAGPFAGYGIERVTLMGTSASSGTVRRYFEAHDELRLPDGSPIYDGFLLTSTNGNEPLPIVDVPMIQMPTQTEVATWAEAGIAYRRAGSDEPGNRFRLYEVAGMPHNNARDNPAFAGDPCTLPVTGFPVGAFTALGLDHLLDWIADGTPPPRAPYIEVEPKAGGGWQVALDVYGNAKGGVRNVWVDVPVATYGVFGIGRTAETDRLCRLAGTEVRLPEATLLGLYDDHADYLRRVEARLEELTHDGWYLPEYVELALEDARAVRIP